MRLWSCLLKHPSSGFSLAELLITLAIMGVIAAFTVPPLFQTPSNRSSRYTAFARDSAFMMLNAYERYKIDHPTTMNPNFQISDLTPYMTYVQRDVSTSSKINTPLTGAWQTGGGQMTCGPQYVANHICYPLYNGAVIWYSDIFYLNGSGSTNAIWFNFDPDGSGPAESLQIWISYPGHIYTAKTLPTTMTFKYIFATTTISPTTQDASWFTGF